MKKLVLCLLLLVGCKEDDNTNTPIPPSGIPVLTTASVNVTSATTATCGGNVTSDGGAAVTVRGVCWSTGQTPTITDGKTTDSMGTGSFTSTVTGLSPNITYYLRAYATNSNGTGYGSTISFQPTGTVPILITSNVNVASATTATCGGNVTSDGGATVIDRGVCWSTGQTPAITDSKTSDGKGTGSFISTVTGLSPKITYYIRAYATNSIGTGYGNTMSVVAGESGTVTDVDGNVYQTVIIGTQIWTVENLKTTRFNDGSLIPLDSDKAVWSSTSLPGYCQYRDRFGTYRPMYGPLYNWYAVNTGKLAPKGWHVPSVGEWKTLMNYLGERCAAKLKEAGTAHWAFPNTGADNSSGFTALPGGSRTQDGDCEEMSEFGYWWSATQSNATSAWFMKLQHENYGNGVLDHDKRTGFSVRCVRD